MSHHDLRVLIGEDLLGRVMADDTDASPLTRTQSWCRPWLEEGIVRGNLEAVLSLHSAIDTWFEDLYIDFVPLLRPVLAGNVTALMLAIGLGSISPGQTRASSA